jgi:hypothetical protein
MMSKTYEVTLPITGIAYLTIEAESEDEAIETALNEVMIDHIEMWEAVRDINRGNVCYAMQPWSAEARETD